MSEVKTKLMELKGLSEFQATIAEYTTMGLSNKEIANQMFTTEEIVKLFLQNIYRVMGLKSRAQLIVYCLQWVPAYQNETKVRGQ